MLVRGDGGAEPGLAIVVQAHPAQLVDQASTAVVALLDQPVHIHEPSEARAADGSDTEAATARRLKPRNRRTVAVWPTPTFPSDPADKEKGAAGPLG